jgi:hypothetical protein
MPRGNPSPKLAVTIEPDVYKGITAEAKRDGVSVSAWLNQAASLELQRRSALALIAGWEADHGAFTEREMESARRKVAEENRLHAAARKRVRKSA